MRKSSNLFVWLLSAMILSLMFISTLIVRIIVALATFFALTITMVKMIAILACRKITEARFFSGEVKLSR